jgi:hypothetical protein
MTVEDADATPPASPSSQPPPQSRGAGGLTERQKKQADEQKARHDEKVIADLTAKLAASNAQLEKAKKNLSSQSSSGEAANSRKRKMSNANTRRKQVPIFRFNSFSGCHFFLTVCLCTGKA